MILVSPTTVRNPAVLETRGLPKRFFGRVLVLPLRLARGDRWRFLFEIQAFRYGLALLPFCLILVPWPGLALPVAQAPLAMVFVIGWVELRVLRVPRSGRARIGDPDAAARALDALRFRATSLLRGIAARHDLTMGELRLVVEQSK